MAQSFKQWIKQAVPPIAKRDQKIAEQREQIRQLRVERKEALTAVSNSAKAIERLNDQIEDLETSLSAARNDPRDRASFEQQIFDIRRTTVALRNIDPAKVHPLRQIPSKLGNYRFAAAHGIPVPRVFQTWESIEAIELDTLPDSFVLKSNGGAGGSGVIPLTRLPNGKYQPLGSGREMTIEQIRRRFAQNPRLSGPFFAEELLKSSDDDGVPHDIKVFAFYGEIGYTQLVQRYGTKRTQFNFVAEDGSSLNDQITHERTNTSIPLPANLQEISDISRHISRAVGVPFVRVDLYETDRGIVLGEVTRGPGLTHRHREDFDTHIGQLYESARLRLETDIANGRPFGMLNANVDLTVSEHAANLECETWCYGR